MLVAVVFLLVGEHGYSSMFLARAAYTVVYFARANLVSPEIQGKTRKGIENFPAQNISVELNR